jgi:hypothetical protein
VQRDALRNETPVQVPLPISPNYDDQSHNCHLHDYSSFSKFVDPQLMLILVLPSPHPSIPYDNTIRYHVPPRAANGSPASPDFPPRHLADPETLHFFSSPYCPNYSWEAPSRDPLQTIPTESSVLGSETKDRIASLPPPPSGVPLCYSTISPPCPDAFFNSRDAVARKQIPR